MRKYICHITSDETPPREYEVTTKSAMQCSEEYGRREYGEIVTVCTPNGKIVSRVIYTPESGGKYYRVAEKLLPEYID